MDKRLVIYGKDGCQKCAVLQGRLGRLGLPFDLRKVDTVDGLVHFCRTEELNPARIPAVVVEVFSPNGFRPLKDSRAHLTGLFGSLAMNTVVGVQTDYDHGGVISPKILTALAKAYLR